MKLNDLLSIVDAQGVHVSDREIYDREFAIKKPNYESDYLLVFGDEQVLLKEDEPHSLPLISEIFTSKEDVIEEDMRYLFTVGDHSFFYYLSLF